jgi:hypothetical protein
MQGKMSWLGDGIIIVDGTHADLEEYAIYLRRIGYNPILDVIADDDDRIFSSLKIWASPGMQATQTAACDILLQI